MKSKVALRQVSYSTGIDIVLKGLSEVIHASFDDIKSA